jgi:hypothetical protein
MSSVRPILVFLLLAMLVRGLPLAHARPAATPQGLETVSVAAPHGCEEHGGAAVTPVQTEDSGTCRIACDLGMAPALAPSPHRFLDEAAAARIAASPAKSAAGVFAPDHPPPIS